MHSNEKPQNLSELQMGELLFEQSQRSTEYLSPFDPSPNKFITWKISGRSSISNRFSVIQHILKEVLFL